MACCEHCTDAESLFTERAARRDLRRYRRKGPTGITRELLDALQEQEPGAGTLLDIGGGVGALQHELLRSGLARAIHVDASRAYLQASALEAERQGHGDRVEYHHGDFVQLADDLARVDVVTLDRVVCCYPDMPALVCASAAKAQRLYALSYPRVRWTTRIARRLANAWFRGRGSSFRTYIHAPREIEAQIERHGFRRVAARRTFLWHAAVYLSDPGSRFNSDSSGHGLAPFPVRHSEQPPDQARRGAVSAAKVTPGHSNIVEKTWPDRPIWNVESRSGAAGRRGARP